MYARCLLLFIPQAVQQGKTAFVLAHGMDVYEVSQHSSALRYGQ
jgi:hypothetical protein